MLTNVLPHFLLILGLLSYSISVPLYNVYNVENEPEAIPLHRLRIQLKQDQDDDEVVDNSNSNEVNEVSKYENEIFDNIFKRREHVLQTDTCCPTTIHIIEPTHGKNRSGDLVELYQSENVRQRFYENSCIGSVLDQPCRYLDRKHSSLSRCVQQYSYTYAMVRDVSKLDSEWKLDYIQIRSGCSCHINKNN